MVFTGRIFTVIQDKLEQIFKNSTATLRNILIFVVVLGLERCFEKDFFKCPATKYRLYGTIFLVCPAVCLFVLTILLNGKFWNILAGCCTLKSRWFVCKRAFLLAFQAFLPSGIWIVIAMIQSKYYVCMRLGPKHAAIDDATRYNKNPKYIAQVKDDIDRKFKQAETDSHIIAWIVFLVLVFCGFLVICIRRSLFLQADGSLPDIDDYQKLEAEAAVESFKNKIKDIASSEGKRFTDEAFERCQDEIGYSQVVYVREKLACKYPRTAGDPSRPFRVGETGISDDMNEFPLHHIKDNNCPNLYYPNEGNGQIAKYQITAKNGLTPGHHDYQDTQV